MLLSKDTITINGKTMTIQEYIDLQDKKEKDLASRREFKSDSKKFDFVKKGPKNRQKYEVLTNGKVIWTRKYTKEDIERIKKEEKIMPMKRKGIRFEVLEYLRERSLEIPRVWIKSSEIKEKFSQYKRSSVTASLAVIFRFLNYEEYAIRRRIPKKGYEYNISQLPENVYEEFVKWSHDFEKRPNRHLKESEKNLNKDFSQIADKDLERSKKEFDEIIRKGTEQTLEKVAEFIKQVDINININGKIKFEFGFMKGE